MKKITIITLALAAFSLQAHASGGSQITCSTPEQTGYLCASAAGERSPELWGVPCDSEWLRSVGWGVSVGTRGYSDYSIQIQHTASGKATVTLAVRNVLDTALNRMTFKQKRAIVTANPTGPGLTYRFQDTESWWGVRGTCDTNCDGLSPVTHDRYRFWINLNTQDHAHSELVVQTDSWESPATGYLNPVRWFKEPRPPQEDRYAQHIPVSCRVSSLP